MSAKPQIAIPAPGSRISYEEFLELPEDRYELNNGVLILTASPTAWHQRIVLRIFTRLDPWICSKGLGVVFSETDFRLGLKLVLRPDVCFISTPAFGAMDPSRSPLQGPPTIAVEVISPSNSASAMAEKLQQYLVTGCDGVWVVYPDLRAIDVHHSHFRRHFAGLATLTDDLLEGFTMPLEEIFNPDITKA